MGWESTCSCYILPSLVRGRLRESAGSSLTKCLMYTSTFFDCQSQWLRL
jgi:hypothetical protein